VNRASLLAVLSLAGCARPAPHHLVNVREVLRDDARLVLERHCGQCHIGAYPSALPRALAVFDLSQTEWSSKMSAAQLKNALARLSAPLAPDGAQNDVTPAERETFGRFVDFEQARFPAR
jgi:hypothetical protein